jgi:predicted dehydrogenase
VADLRVAVIGVGHLGKHHARLLAGIEGAALVAVADTDQGRAAAAVGESGARVLADYRQLFDQVDAVTVAVPTELHHEIALPFLARGVSVLVEKPMTRSLAEADELIAAAAASGATLAVGHTERYNPAVAAVGVPVLTDKYDIANARLRFSTGCIANVTASRISRERVRKIRFFQPDAYVSIDYAEQEVEGYRLKRREGQRPEIQGGKLPVTREEPLKRELTDFVRAVIDKRRPLVAGEDGRRALALAQAIADKMETV